MVVYKSGVALLECSGTRKSGENIFIESWSSGLDDLLKSLVIQCDSSFAGLRYEMESGETLEEGPIQFENEVPLAKILDSCRGSRIELQYHGSTLSGCILSARLARLPHEGQKQELTLWLDSGELLICDLDAASNIRLTDPALQAKIARSLASLAGKQSRRRVRVWIDFATQDEQAVTARYLVPHPAWKSAYRLVLPDSGDPTLEGWAIVENIGPDDWDSVGVTVVSGKPISFRMPLSRHVIVGRKKVSVPGVEPEKPRIHDKPLAETKTTTQGSAPRSRESSRGFASSHLIYLKHDDFAAKEPEVRGFGPSSVAMAAETSGSVETFQYRFSMPVKARRGEAVMIPFFQGVIDAKKVVIYSDKYWRHPRHGVEITNTTGVTLDSGSVTVYTPDGFAGDALIEVLKNGEKCLVSYAVDYGTHITTTHQPDKKMIRGVKAVQGTVTTRIAFLYVTTYRIANMDPVEKRLLIEHAVSEGTNLVTPRADSLGRDSYRFTVPLPANSSLSFEVVEEELTETTASLRQLSADYLFEFEDPDSLTPALRDSLAAVTAKRRELAAVEDECKRVDAALQELARNQERLRQNIRILRNLAGQEELLNRNVAELVESDARISTLRERLASLRDQKDKLAAELNDALAELEL